MLFARKGRTWPALALLFLLKDFRLLVILPIIAAAFFVAAQRPAPRGGRPG